MVASWHSAFAPWTATITKILLFVSLIFIISENADSHCTDYRGGGRGKGGGGREWEEDGRGIKWASYLDRIINNML